MEQAVATIRPPRVGEMGHVLAGNCYAAVVVAVFPGAPPSVRVNYFMPAGAVAPWDTSHLYRVPALHEVGGSWHRVEECPWQR